MIVVGHGHYDGRHSHLNLPGPDLDERAFAKLFEGLKAREQVFFITTRGQRLFSQAARRRPAESSSRRPSPTWRSMKRCSPTLWPTCSPLPRQGTDRNKDGKISVFELYLAVAADVMKRYADGENLPTEHARLDDNGDGRGSELQERYLPPELGGRAAAARPEPAIGPKDDGALASRILH